MIIEIFVLLYFKFHNFLKVSMKLNKLSKLNFKFVFKGLAFGRVHSIMRGFSYERTDIKLLCQSFKYEFFLEKAKAM